MIPAIDLPTTFDESNQKTWETLALKLEWVRNTTITLTVTNGEGGLVCILRPFLRAMQKAQRNNCKIIAKITNENWSAHAFVAAYADCRIFSESSSLIFHNFGVEKSFPFGLFKWRSLNIAPDDVKLQEEVLSLCLKKHILSSEDIAKMSRRQEITIQA